MDHVRYRMLIASDPRSADPELRDHRDGCPECSLYTEQLLRFENRLERALGIDIPVRAARHTAVRSWNRMAIAASVLLGLIVAGGVWLGLPERSLAADVVAHMAGEPEAWQRTDVAVPDPALNAVLVDSKVKLAPSAGTVSYASSCFFRGHYVPHLVVQTGSGPVTVMVLVHESVKKPMQFDEHGYRGTIVPMPGHGGLAVLMRDPGTDREEIEQIAARVRDAIVWTP
jgi:hypothetical protein